MGKPPWTIGWGNLSRQNFFNDRVHSQSGVTDTDRKVREGFQEGEFS